MSIWNGKRCSFLLATYRYNNGLIFLWIRMLSFAIVCFSLFEHHAQFNDGKTEKISLKSVQTADVMSCVV